MGVEHGWNAVDDIHYWIINCASIWSREVSTPGMRSVIYFSGACDCVSIKSMGGEHARYMVNDIH